ncbi:hypothetical protein [Burkholderia cepacia]
MTVMSFDAEKNETCLADHAGEAPDALCREVRLPARVIQYANSW